MQDVQKIHVACATMCPYVKGICGHGVLAIRTQWSFSNLKASKLGMGGMLAQGKRISKHNWQRRITSTVRKTTQSPSSTHVSPRPCANSKDGGYPIYA